MRSRIVAIALWTAGMAVVFLLVLEGLTRLTLRWTEGEWPQTRAVEEQARNEILLRLYRRHPYFNTGPREGAAEQFAGRSAAFNSEGYRSPERPLSAPPGVVRVLCAGGSTTFDLLASSNDQTWPAMLEANLRTQGFDAEVWNAGFPGWTSAENAVSLLLRDQDLRADVVILFQGINDLQPAAHRPFDRHYEAGHADQQVQALGLQTPPPQIWQRSVLVDRLRSEPPVRRLDLNLAETISPEAPQVFRRNVGSFVSIARAAGARVILATQPIRIRPQHRESDLAYLESWLGLSGESVPMHLETMNDVLRDAAVEQGVTLADLAADLDLQAEDFGDPMHYSASGSTKIANYFATITAAAVRSGSSERLLDDPTPKR